MSTNTPEMILALLAQNQELVPAHTRGRWALLVTFDEMDALVDHLGAHPEFGVPIAQEHAVHIKAGRAMLHINGTPVLPELMPPEQQRSN